jgi:branched-chain amino acid transport system permease protein
MAVTAVAAADLTPGARSASAAGRAVAGARLLSTTWHRLAVAGLCSLVLVVPLGLLSDVFWLSVLNFAGIAAVGAIGLNVLTGYAGQVSLGHAFFLAVGAYTAILLGDQWGLPLLVWLPGCAAVGGLLGAAVAPFALRLRGPYLAIVSLGLVFAGTYGFQMWRSLTGGPGGTAAELPLSLAGLDFADLRLGSTRFSREQGLFVLIWAVVALSVLVVRNITRSRVGRAMEAVRDHDLAAELVGVETFRTKTAAFVVSSALGAIAGGLYVAQIRYVQPETFDLLMSVQYVNIIIVGGIGTTAGPVLGALFMGGLPQIIQRYSDQIPVVQQGVEAEGFGLTVSAFNLVLYGALIVAFLMGEPRGIDHLVRRARRRVAARLRSTGQDRTTQEGD